MKRRFLSAVLAFVIAAAFLLSDTASATSLEGKLNAASSNGNSSAASKAYGKVYALNQPVILDWSAYAAYGTEYSITVFNLKTFETVLSYENTIYTWGIHWGKAKGTYAAYVQVFDGNGNQTKEIWDFFHIGSVAEVPSFIPDEKLVLRGVLAKDAKKYAAFSDPYWAASSMIFGDNPYFEDDNSDADPALWLNRPVNSNFGFDSFNVLRKGYASSKYSYNYLLEARLFSLVNQYRALNGKAELAWNDTLGYFDRLRATAMSDNPLKNNECDLSEVGGMGTDNDLRRYGFNPPGTGSGWFDHYPFRVDWDNEDVAYAIFDGWLESADLRADMLGDYKYGAIGIVLCNRILGKKQAGMAYIMDFQN